jgi:ABC-type dipeptide/oligopeptide/nickel transport system permease component
LARYVAARLLAAVPLLLGASIISFLVLQLTPGDPVQALLFGTNATPGEVKSLTIQLGLDKPVWTQYAIYLQHLFEGNLGTSYANQESVAQEIFSQIPYTIELAAGALIVGLALGIPAGLVAGRWTGSWPDRVASSLSILFVAVPYFWLGELLILIFAVRLGWLPALGVSGVSGLVLPSITLGIGYAALTARLLRANVAEIYKRPLVTFARGRGCSERDIFFRSVLKGASGPMVTVVGLSLGNMLSSAAAVETIFGRPGIGSLFVQSILAKNIPVIQGLLLVVTTIYILLNLVVDVIKAYLDPRIRLRGMT